MHMFVKSVIIMAARKRTRRGRRRNRSNSSRRKLFVPAVYPSINGRKRRQSLRSSFSQEKLKTNSTKLPVTVSLNSKFVSVNSLDKENSICEFTYSHWWNKTPQKKSHKLVRPPYTPTAPNNSTQYIINDRVPFENIYDIPEESENLCDLNGSLVSGLGRNDFDVRLSDCESISCRTPGSETMESASVGTLSPALIPETLSSTYEDDDSHYESPEDIDFFAFVQNDFLENYENMKRESLLRLSKE